MQNEAALNKREELRKHVAFVFGSKEEKASFRKEFGPKMTNQVLQHHLREWEHKRKWSAVIASKPEERIDGTVIGPGKKIDEKSIRFLGKPDGTLAKTVRNIVEKHPKALELMKESGLPVLVAEAIRNYHGRTEIDEKQKADIISLLSSYKNPEDLKDAIKVIAEHGIPGLKALIHLPRKQGEKIKPSKILELFNVGIDAKIRGDTVHSLAHSRWEREGTPLDEVIADLRNSKK